MKNKVSPPRLEGNKVGIFSTRSPNRPNPIGLSLVKLEKREKSTLFVSGVDLIDGTPILDIKPYIHKYDSVENSTVPSWIDTPPRDPPSHVIFSTIALQHLEQLVPSLEYYSCVHDIKTAIEEILYADPRTTFRGKWNWENYDFRIDNVRVYCEFEQSTVKIVKIIPEDYQK
eukprot:TRINITY_DN668_c0_g1_i3.p1 TRINITY_DN668_c0_g1~~TRINITY_DN668_c0_g1_i3.p1  ORF type:complete len:172 (+),score=37.39 TRINITY_DN668_c0_g1_i3:381-896(+)